MSQPEVEEHCMGAEGAGVYCRMWEHREDMKEAEGCCIERAIKSDYIHNRMSKQINESHVRCSSVYCVN
jgi:hypothetical protein